MGRAFLYIIAAKPTFSRGIDRRLRLTKARIQRLVAELKRLYPTATCALHHRNSFELIVATVLSAQCTDDTVNKVTPDLFAAFPSPDALATAQLEAVEALIRRTGFYRNKAKNIVALAQALVADHQSTVPEDMDTLVTLPGVGRKTANVVRITAFGLPGLTVDTHFGRLARRIGITKETDPVKVEFDVQTKVPEADWGDLSHLLIWHGRNVCHARKPLCDACTLRGDCEVGQGAPDPHVSGKKGKTKAQQD